MLGAVPEGNDGSELCARFLRFAQGLHLNGIAADAVSFLHGQIDAGSRAPHSMGSTWSAEKTGLGLVMTIPMWLQITPLALSCQRVRNSSRSM